MSGPAVEDGWGGQKVSGSKLISIWPSEGCSSSTLLRQKGKRNCLLQELKLIFVGRKGERNQDVVRSVVKERGVGRKSNVTPGGKFLDHLLESA